MKYVLFILTLLSTLSFISSCDKNPRSEKKNPIANEIATEKEEIGKTKIDLENDLEELQRKNDSLDAKFERFQTLTEIENLVSYSNLDHISIAVKNLNKTRKTFSTQLGFTTKEGSQHLNGITNFFIEFSSGRKLEVITSRNGNDKLSQWYSSFLEGGDGGAFVAYNSNSLNILQDSYTKLDISSELFRVKDLCSILSFLNYDDDFPMFFLDYGANKDVDVTHHANGAFNLQAVWITVPNLVDAVDYFYKYGFLISETIQLPNHKAGVITVGNSQIYVIEDGTQIRVYGATLLVKDLAATMSFYDEKKIEFESFSLNFKKRKSLIVSSKHTNNFQLEFLESERK